MDSYKCIHCFKYKSIIDMFYRCDSCNTFIMCNDCSDDLMYLYNKRTQWLCDTCNTIYYYSMRKSQTIKNFYIIDQELIEKTCHPKRLQWTLDDEDKKDLDKVQLKYL